MYNVTLLEYDLLSQTHLQRQLNGGTIIKEVLTNSLNYIEGNMPKKRKLMIYSGNERNIAAVLKNLDLWSPHIPNEAASVIFEMYFDNETQIHGIKVFIFLLHYDMILWDDLKKSSTYLVEYNPRNNR